MKRTITLFLVATLLLYTVVFTCEAQVIQVKPGMSIQAAIDQAQPGDTIQVKRGVYHENIIVNKPLSLIGTKNTVIMGTGPLPVIRVTSRDVNISCFRITTNGSGIGVLFQGVNKGLVKGCEIYACAEGVCLLASNYTIVRQNQIHDCVQEIGAGIHLDYMTYWHDESQDLITSNHNLIKGNTITRCSFGVFGLYGSGDILQNNQIKNTYGEAISIYNLDDFTIRDNNLGDNFAGMSISNCYDGIIKGNWIRNSTDYGIALQSWYVTVFNNGFTGNHPNSIGTGYNGLWNTTKRHSRNIVGGPYIGGNYWDDYTGQDINGDYLGDTLTPFNGDYLPLIRPGGSP